MPKKKQKETECSKFFPDNEKNIKEATGQHHMDVSHQNPQHQYINPGHYNPMQGGAIPPQHMVPPQIHQQQLQLQMMQMMQMMKVQSGIPGVDTAAQPFNQESIMEDTDAGLDADIIRPHHLRSVLKTQEALPVHEVLDSLCLNKDGKHSLGGIPKGCTIAFAGPPGHGKTRTAISALCKVAFSGIKCGFVVAEEGFIDSRDSGRDDLCSRLTQIGMCSLSLSEAQFQKKVARNIAVIQSQYHKGQTWDRFVAKYRYIVEKEGVRFIVIDSLNTLDPSRTKTADNLSALKTYNHEKGVTCLTIGQIRDTGMPVGGEALMHTADTVFLLEKMGLTSKEMAAFWGGKYRDRISIIKVIKSVTTPIFPHPVRVTKDENIGMLKLHPAQPEEYSLFPKFVS